MGKTNDFIYFEISNVFCSFRALMGLIVSVIAMISGWGLTMYVGIHPWQATNLASVFLLLGVGIDDTFVMLSAWKRIQGNLFKKFKKNCKQNFKI